MGGVLPHDLLLYVCLLRYWIVHVILESKGFQANDPSLDLAVSNKTKQNIYIYIYMRNANERSSLTRAPCEANLQATALRQLKRLLIQL